MKITRFLFLSAFLALCFTGCTVERAVQRATEQSAQTATVLFLTEIVPTATLLPTVVPSVTPEPLRLEQITVYIPPDLPEGLRQKVQLPDGVSTVSQPDEAMVQVNTMSREAFVEPGQQALWVYVLVAPFPTVLDEVPFKEVQRAWRGEQVALFENHALMMTPETRHVFELVWGKPGNNGIQLLEKKDLLDAAWKNQPAWAIIPFEEVSPRWKVLSIEGQSPIHKDFKAADYPLAVAFELQGDKRALQAIQTAQSQGVFPKGNRDPQKMTTLLMTGTTALVRNTALRMEEKGVTYPGQDVQDWMREADLTHVSNEVSFWEKCPPAKPLRREMRFCSSPDYFKLFEFLHVDIIELTGNHMLDWGVEPFKYTLDLYRQKNLPFFGGGDNLEIARQPLLVEHNGNKFAFIGCSQAGPPNVWATKDRPGSAPCDYDWETAKIQELSKAGYLPVITFQHYEVMEYKPASAQRVDSQKMAEAGALIVSGSQSHYPQAMTFVNGNFVHYGLGNLFFDQMDKPVKGIRRAFIDRHVFYDGKYINTELLTTMLEDYARPRPMTAEERTDFLTKVFAASVWPATK
jgi:poly-gamma-glutamate synthesis protein (capsule biosynthesis protein)